MGVEAKPLDEVPLAGPAPRSGRVVTDAQGLVAYSNQDDLENLLSQLESHVDQAAAEDKAEVDIAKSCIPRDWNCREGYDAEATATDFQSLEQEAKGSRKNLRSATFNFLSTAGAVGPNMENGFNPWKQIASQLAELKYDASGLAKVPDWEGEAADAYAARIQQQVKQVDAMAALARAARDSVEAVSLMQAALCNAAADVLQRAHEQLSKFMKDMHLVPEEAQQKFSNLSGEGFFSRPFYQRTNYAISVLSTARKDMDSVISSNQEWRDAANEANKILIAAAEEAKRWNAAKANYNTNVGVYAAYSMLTGRDSDRQHFKKNE